MYQQSAENITSCVFFCLFFFLGWKNKATPQQYGAKPICCFDTSVTSEVSGGLLQHLATVCVPVCDGVINCVCFHTHLLWIFGMLPYMHIRGIWPCVGRAGQSVCHTCCMRIPPCENSWAVSGVTVPEALLDDRCLQASLARLDSPCTPEAVQELEPGLSQAWLKDPPLISPVSESVNSRWMTSSGPTNRSPSVIT